MRFLFFFIFTSYLFASHLVNTNFFNLNNKVDILLSLDEKFHGKIKEIDKNKLIITNISATKEFYKKFENSIIDSILISPFTEDSIKVDIKTDNYIKISAALTPDGYGLRIRVYKPLLNNNSYKENSTETFNYTKYTLIMIILIAISVILWYISKKLKQTIIKNNNINILNQAFIDSNNRIVVIEYNNKKYILLIGNSNILLDKIESDEFQLDKEDIIKDYIKQQKDIDERI